MAARSGKESANERGAGRCQKEKTRELHRRGGREGEGAGADAPRDVSAAVVVYGGEYRRRIFLDHSDHRGDQRQRTRTLHLDWAAIAILFAIPFDSLDGRIARMTNTTSDFGRELDSLADVITFGVAPSLLAFVWGFHFLPDSINPQLRQHLVQAGGFICFLFLIGGASRLARFNISHDPQPRNPGRPDRKYFVGMPIPAAAGLLGRDRAFLQWNPECRRGGLRFRGWSLWVWPVF